MRGEWWLVAILAFVVGTYVLQWAVGKMNLSLFLIWLYSWWAAICHSFHRKPFESEARFVERPRGEYNERRFECTKCETVKSVFQGTDDCPFCPHRTGGWWDYSKRGCKQCNAEGGGISNGRFYKPPQNRGEPIDPKGESDCPECSNGVIHENCRTGWKAVLQEAWDLYNSKWVPPCDSCGGNCGQCASTHCGICGVKPRDGECDQKKHRLFERHQASKAQQP